MGSGQWIVDGRELDSGEWTVRSAPPSSFRLPPSLVPRPPPLAPRPYCSLHVPCPSSNSGLPSARPACLTYDLSCEEQQFYDGKFTAEDTENAESTRSKPQMNTDGRR